LLNSNISSIRPHNMTNFVPLTAEINSGVCGTTTNFNGFRVLTSLLGLHRRHSTEVNQTLHDVWPSLGLVLYVYIIGALAPNGILKGAKFTLRPNFAFSYIGSVILHGTRVEGVNQTLGRSGEGGHLYSAGRQSSFLFFPRLFSAVAEWMSTILPHMVWP